MIFFCVVVYYIHTQHIPAPTTTDCLYSFVRAFNCACIGAHHHAVDACARQFIAHFLHSTSANLLILFFLGVSKETSRVRNENINNTQFLFSFILRCRWCCCCYCRHSRRVYAREKAANKQTTHKSRAFSTTLIYS